jgi:hypothetical protein
MVAAGPADESPACRSCSRLTCPRFAPAALAPAREAAAWAAPTLLTAAGNEASATSAAALMGVVAGMA